MESHGEMALIVQNKLGSLTFCEEGGKHIPKIKIVFGNFQENVQM